MFSRAQPFVSVGSRQQVGSATRFRQLDSLRGIAALFVVFNHYVQAVPEHVRLLPGTMLSSWATPWPWLRFTPLRLAVDGEAAVDIFFVLSGFVLSLPVTRDYQPAFWPFVVKRLCRVYLPFAAVILIIAAAYALIPTAPSAFASDWLNALLPTRTGYSLVDHLLMTGRTSDMTLDPVMWTLVHEVRMSVVLPLIFLTIRKIGTPQAIGGSLLISILASLGLHDSVSGSWSATLHFLWMFTLGCALALQRRHLAELAGRGTAWMTACLWVFALSLLAVPFNRVWADFLIGGGAALAIVLCLPQSRLANALVSPVPLWLGRVSYSLYLIHLPLLILAVTGGLLAGTLIGTFLATLVAAEIAYRAIEAPAHRLGISLSRLIGSVRKAA